jgi:hypothetical protein
MYHISRDELHLSHLILLSSYDISIRAYQPWLTAWSMTR